VIWPPEYQAWARTAGLMPRGSDVPVRDRDATGVAEGVELEAQTQVVRRSPTFAISSPPSGATYLIDPTLRKEFQTLPLRVALSGPPRDIRWTLNDRPLGTTRSDRTIDWPLVPGSHHFVATDGKQTAEATVVVK